MNDDFLKGLLNTNTGTNKAPPLTIDVMLKAMDTLRKREDKPRVSRFYANHSVPYGRVFRMWTTRGEMIAYVNRGQIADMPRAPEPCGNGYPGWALSAPSVFGIPIYYE